MTTGINSNIRAPSLRQEWQSYERMVGRRGPINPVLTFGERQASGTTRGAGGVKPHKVELQLLRQAFAPGC